jgi:hypothetical protein
VIPSGIKVALPYHLRNLAGVGMEIEIEVPPPVTQRALIDAIEARYPMLRGTIRDPATGLRRPFLRFFACGLDYSHDPPDAILPPEVVAGRETFLVVGAIAGG